MFRVSSVWLGLEEVGQMGFPSLFRGEQEFQPNNEVMDFPFPELELP